MDCACKERQCLILLWHQHWAACMVSWFHLAVLECSQYIVYWPLKRSNAEEKSETTAAQLKIWLWIRWHRHFVVLKRTQIVCLLWPLQKILSAFLKNFKYSQVVKKTRLRCVQVSAINNYSFIHVVTYFNEKFRFLLPSFIEIWSI